MPRAWVLIVIVGFSTLRFLYPGDIPFINDEALLIQRALEDNSSGRLTVSGLMGSRGLDYGPFAIWFYRLALVFTHDLQTVALIKMAFFFVLTLGSLLWISRVTGIPRFWPLFLALASPYLWFYSRDLWDNSFVIPLSALFYAAYFDFTSSKRFSSFILSVIALSFGFLTHLVFMPILVAFVIHFACFEHAFYKRYPGRVVLTAVICLGGVSPYLLHAFIQRPAQHLNPGDLGHALMPFTGARFFTSMGLEYFLGDVWKNPVETPILNSLWWFSIGISVLAYPLFVYGLFLLVKDGSRRTSFSVILLSFLFQILLAYTYRLIPIPNFHSAQWIVYLLAIATALDKLKRKSYLVYPYVASLAMGVPAFLILVHTYGGSRAIHYGPTLENQKTVAKTLSQLDTNKILREAFHPSQFPFALDLLVRLEAPIAKKRVDSVRILYEDPMNAKNGRIIAQPTE